MIIGTVKTWIGSRGFGFIAPDSGDGDVFVHISRVTAADELRVGDRVQFEPGINPRNGKPEARDVRLVD